MKLIKYGAEWCVGCNHLTTTLSTIDHPLLNAYTDVDIDSDVKAAVAANIKSIPTLVITDEDGNELRRLCGNHGKKSIIEFLA
jgi:thioredoxin-like negative regulator of GroEL